MKESQLKQSEQNSTSKTKTRAKVMQVWLKW
jgi:hypothetical protein